MIKSFWTCAAILFLFQALAACSGEDQSTNAVTPSINNVDKPVNTDKAAIAENLVIAFGDSLYAGYQLGPKEGFAPKLQEALMTKGYDVNVQNAGVSGDTTAAGKARLNFVLDAAKQDIDLVILGLGGNDMLRGIQAKETRANITAMLDELKKRNIDVVLTGMLAPPNLGADYEKDFNSIYPDLAKQYNVALYPFFLEGIMLDSTTLDKKLMLSDNIHPNAKGITQIIEKITPTIEAALKAD